MPKGANLHFPHLLLLEASAGTGKTQALAERFVNFFLAPQKNIPNNRLPQFLAITFTKKAAHEMKERILQGLKGMALKIDPEAMEKRAEKLGLKPEILAGLAVGKVEEILEHYTDFQVQTIDSFTNRVIRALALELGMRPEPEIVLDYAELLPYALSLLLREVGPSGEPATTRSAEAFLALLNRTPGEGFVWDPVASLEDKFDGFLEREAKEMGRLVFQDRSKAIEKGFRDFNSALDAIRKVFPEVQFREELEKALEGKNLFRLMDWKYNTNTVPAKKSSGEVFTRVEKVWVSLNGIMERLALAQARGYYHPYGRLYAGFKSKLELAKRRTGEIHLDDVGRTLSQALREEVLPDVYLRMGDRLYHFLIDEFQDTNLLQWRSLLPLIKESLSKGGSLFLVGDLKQAIFMFRRGDYRIMRGLLEGIKKGVPDPEGLLPGVGPGASRETLEVNYRSGEVILDFVAEVFQKKLKGLLGTEHFREDLTGLTDFPQKAAGKHKGKGCVETRRFLRTRDAPDPEKDDLVEIIRDLKKRGYGYREIAILSATNRDLERMVAWLTEANIPATATSALDIRKRKVVGELLELLKFLDSPVDDLAFAQFAGGIILREAREGIVFEQDDLGRLAEGRKAPLYQAFREDPNGKLLWERLFKDLYQKVGYCPLYELLTSALAAFKVLENFPKEAAALMRLMEVVNHLEEEGKGSLRDLLELAGEEKEDLFALDLPEYTDAVRLLTFHKAKGLGFPVVINRLEEPKGDGGDHFVKEGEDIQLFHLTAKLTGWSPELERMAEEKELGGQIQGLNTLYVAMTRAREELYNLVVLAKEEGLVFTLFEEGKWGRKERRELGGEALPEVTPARIPRIAEEKRLPGERWTYGRWLEARKGEAYHRVLEELEFLSDKPEEEVSKAVERHRYELLGFADPETLKAELLAFLKRESVKEWFEPRPGRQVLREAEFADGNGDLLRMDRVVCDEKAVAVLDYKTGGEEDYGGQIAKYKGILGKVFPGKAVKGIVAYVDSGKVVEE